MILLLKGIAIGIANIIPGISGSAIMIITGIYQETIYMIANIFKDIKKSIKFLLPLSIGIIFGTIMFAKVIYYTINIYPLITKIIFAFFVLGMIPSLCKQSIKKGFKYKYIIAFFITFIIGITLVFIKSHLNLENNILTFILIGIFISLSSIIPGISSTVLLNLVGAYNTYIASISCFNITYLLPMIIGFIICSFYLSKLINYLINKYYGYTFFSILGFTCSTILILFKDLSFSINTLLLGLIPFIISYLSFKLTNKTYN